MDLRKQLEKLTLPQLATALSAVVYISGYLISSMYVRSRGINQMSVISAQYIETGLVFVILTALLVMVPIVIALMALDSRKRHGYPSLLLCLVYPLVTTNYLFVFTFFCLFVTRYEWLLNFPIFGVTVGLAHCFAAYTLLLFILQVLFLCLKYGGKACLKWPVVDLDKADDKPILVTVLRKWLAGTVIVVSLIGTVAFDSVLYFRLGWFPEFASRAIAYVFCIVLIACIGGVLYYLTRIYTDVAKRWQFWLIAGPLFLVLYYFALSSYEFGVYINIPMSRGGKYPVTQTTLYFAVDSLQARAGQKSLTAYVVEETDDYYYVVPLEVENWFQEHPPVEGIRKTDVAYPHYDHLRSGEPRTNHLRAGGQDDQRGGWRALPSATRPAEPSP